MYKQEIENLISERISGRQCNKKQNGFIKNLEYL